MLSPESSLPFVLAAVFAATLVRSTFGFGEALVAVPLLAFVIPVKAAVPLATLLSVTVAVLVLLQDWRKVHVRSAWQLILPTFAGIPIGLYVLAAGPAALVKVALAVVIIGFSSYCLFSRRRLHLRDDRSAWVFGLAAGVLGGAYAINGPPLVVFGTLRGWTPQHFRATLQGYFLPASAVALAGYWLAGLWAPEVTRYYLLSLPVTVVAVWIGRVINHRMQLDVFIRYVHMGLIGIGLILLAQAASM